MNLYSELYCVEYMLDKGKMVLTMPFAFLNWRLMELFADMADEITDMDDVQSSDIAKTSPLFMRLLCLNILPRQRTFLHFIYKNSCITEYCLNRV